MLKYSGNENELHLSKQ